MITNRTIVIDQRTGVHYRIHTDTGPGLKHCTRHHVRPVPKLHCVRTDCRRMNDRRKFETECAEFLKNGSPSFGIHNPADPVDQHKFRRITAFNNLVTTQNIDTENLGAVSRGIGIQQPCNRYIRRMQRGQHDDSMSA